MNYEEGIQHMIALHQACEDKMIKQSFQIGDLTITYPGYKHTGDYRLSKGNAAPKHTDVMRMIYNQVTTENFEQFCESLDNLYQHGLKSVHGTINQADKELIFWITLQEEINYPQSQGYAGRKLPFQRFYEAALAKLGHVQFQNVLNRAENKGTGRPALFNLPNIKYPSFYQ